jgi:hypothetical protein
MIITFGPKAHRTLSINIGWILLLMATVEASLLGNGRLLMVGPLTLKMWIFVAAQAYVIARLAAGARLKVSTLAITLSMVALMLLGTMQGLIRGGDGSIITDDVKPLLYFLMIPFVELVLTSVEDLRTIISIIESACILMCAIYVAVVVLVVTGVLRFLTVYKYVDDSREILFRGYGVLVFYAGAIYLGIGLIFYLFEANRKKRLWALLCMAGLVVTGTRGFLLGLAGVLVVHLITARMSIRRRMIYLGVVMFCCGSMILIVLKVFPSKSAGDQIRVQTISEVIDRLTPNIAILGTGFGIGVPSRPDRMEISYLEIFSKQGVLGLCWWLIVFFLIIYRYIHARKLNYVYAQPLFLSVIFVAVAAATNPYLENPIGLFICIMAYVGLSVCSRIEAHPVRQRMISMNQADQHAA